MSCYLYAENFPDRGSVYIRENGQLYKANQASGGVNKSDPKPRPSRLFSKGFSVELCVNRENDNGRTDHFIFTYTKKGNLRYSAKSLFSLVLSYIADNIHHVDSLVDFPEQIAEKLFYAADARQKFTEPRTGLCALQKFIDAYGSLVLQTLCLKNGLTRLLLKDNCLSDAGLRKMTAPVRVMKRGLENLSVLDLSCNPGITRLGLRYLLPFKKLNCLDLSGTCLKDTNAVVCWIQTQIGLVHSEVPLKEFDHNSCKTEGWAEQTILQWEHAVQEAIKPQESLKSQTAAQLFYGKRARTEEPLEIETSENLQFYRPRAEMLNLPVLIGKSEELQKKKKRASAEHKEQRFKSKQLSFSVADWDLLNSY
ncbi:leucine-rich repeat-containing protein 42 isoform X2 [Podarcis raffonei]|uniref:leucine-rich repeat-containing protein 42 isoform X2 n=1 Tax=Podarcis raffonei TaxID=65483 RepID=UPI00232928F1|nr:leucine-rich repeat-containing protein 42 isoform X2 [Podarcis raffonei]